MTTQRLLQPLPLMPQTVLVTVTRLVASSMAVELLLLDSPPHGPAPAALSLAAAGAVAATVLGRLAMVAVARALSPFLGVPAG